MPIDVSLSKSLEKTSSVRIDRRHIPYERAKEKLVAPFSTGVTEVRKQWETISKILKCKREIKNNKHSSKQKMSLNIESEQGVFRKKSKLSFVLILTIRAYARKTPEKVPDPGGDPERRSETQEGPGTFAEC